MAARRRHVAELTRNLNSVAVIGGGIAGAAACIRLAQSGVAPIWISPEQELDFKPGEHLSAAAIPLLKEIGSDALLRSSKHRQAHSIYSAWGSEILTERNSIVQLEGAPTVLDRIVFEQSLTQQAVAAGTTRMFGSVGDLAIQDGSWHLEVDGESVHAEFIIDATGRKSLVGSRLSTRFQADQLSCIFGISVQDDDGVIPRPVTLIEAAEHGWWYMSVLSDGRAVVNYFTDPDLIQRTMDRSKTEYMQSATKLPAIGGYMEEFGYSTINDIKLVTTNTTWLAPVIGPGWVAIGDAAAAFDPLSSHGMTTALWTAITASDAYLSKDISKMHSYSKEVASGVDNFLTSRQQMYALEGRFRRNEFWRRRQSFKVFEEADLK